MKKIEMYRNRYKKDDFYNIWKDFLRKIRNCNICSYLFEKYRIFIWKNFAFRDILKLI